MKKQIVVLVLAAVLVFGCAVGGTLAWLLDSTETVTNTFTYGDVDIDLAETCDDEFELIPGTVYTKDPTVTVKAASEACYVFVEIVENDAVVAGTGGAAYETKEFTDYVTYAVDAGWTALPGVPGVYYKEVADTDEDQEFGILASNQVTISTSVTKADIDAYNRLDASIRELPTLSFTAYAVQKANVADAATAWGYVNP